MHVFGNRSDVIGSIDDADASFCPSDSDQNCTDDYDSSASQGGGGIATDATLELGLSVLALMTRAL